MVERFSEVWNVSSLVFFLPYISTTQLNVHIPITLTDAWLTLSWEIAGQHVHVTFTMTSRYCVWFQSLVSRNFSKTVLPFPFPHCPVKLSQSVYNQQQKWQTTKASTSHSLSSTIIIYSSLLPKLMTLTTHLTHNHRDKFAIFSLSWAHSCFSLHLQAVGMQIRAEQLLSSQYLQHWGRYRVQQQEGTEVCLVQQANVQATAEWCESKHDVCVCVNVWCVQVRPITCYI